MKHIVLALFAMFFLGCRSVHVIEANWSESATLTLIDSLGQTGQASLLLDNHPVLVTQRFRVTGDSVHFPDVDEKVSRFQTLQGVWRESAVALFEIRELQIRPPPDRGRFMVKSVFALGSTGTAAGLYFAIGCSYSGRCSPGSKVALGAGVGVALGMLVGSVGGGGKKTVYRFRPDTPQQMSVVIGVGPSMSGRRQNVDGYGKERNR